MSHRTPRKVVEALYRAFENRDEEMLTSLMDPSISWNQCAGFPGGASRSGIEEVLSDVFRSNRDRWVEFQASVLEMLVDGNSVVVLGEYSGRHFETGKGMKASFVHVYRVQNGKIERFDQIADTWPMVSASHDFGTATG